MAITQRDDFTGEVRDSFGNWHRSEDEYLEAEANEGERRFEEMRDEGLLDNVYTDRLK